MVNLRYEKDDLQVQPRVHHDENIVRRSEEVRQVKATIRRSEEKSKEKMTRVFAIAKKPSPQRRMVG